MNVQLTGHHNDSGSGAQGWVGPCRHRRQRRTARRWSSIGNFKYANGAAARPGRDGRPVRHHRARCDRGPPTRYAPLCFNWAFDTYVRGVSFSPDGSYFVINATGGGNGHAVRRHRPVRDQPQRHQRPADLGRPDRWRHGVGHHGHQHRGLHRRPQPVEQQPVRRRPGPARRRAAAGPGGARPGHRSSVRVEPGPQAAGRLGVRGLATARGALDRLGHRLHRQPPVQAAASSRSSRTPAAPSPASTRPPTLPGTVYLGGSKGTGATNVLYRVNAGGAAIQSLDSGPDWAGDTAATRARTATAAATRPARAGGETSTARVPATTPSAIFDSERWSPTRQPAMNWSSRSPPARRSGPAVLREPVHLHLAAGPAGLQRRHRRHHGAEPLRHRGRRRATRPAR